MITDHYLIIGTQSFMKTNYGQYIYMKVEWLLCFIEEPQIIKNDYLFLFDFIVILHVVSS